jgi:hypothetical protein
MEEKMTKLFVKQAYEKRVLKTRVIFCPDCDQVRTPPGWLPVDNETRIRLIRVADEVLKECCPECNERKMKIQRLELAAGSCGACCEL